jgi:hypothetical protein
MTEVPLNDGKRGCTYSFQHAHCFPCAWTGGQGTVPYEQNTQQSPGRGLNTAWQCSHS